LLHFEDDGFGLTENVENGGDRDAGRFLGIDVQDTDGDSIGIRDDRAVPEAGAGEKARGVAEGHEAVEGFRIVEETGRQTASPGNHLEFAAAFSVDVDLDLAPGQPFARG